MPWRIRLVLVIAAGSLAACSSSASDANSSGVQAGSCTTAVVSAPTLQVSSANVSVPGNPFDVVATADGRWSFVTLNNAVDVLSNTTPIPVISAQLSVSGNPTGEQLSRNGRYLLVADDSGAVVMDVALAENGAPNALVGVLSSPAGQGAIEVALSPDDRFAFVALETSDSIAVFDLEKAIDQGFGRSDFVGTVPLGGAPVGLAISPDGRWIYATSESAGAGSPRGTLTAIDLGRAETSPTEAVAVTVPAGCSPVRVITSADGSILWVSARGSDAVLGFSATRLLSDPRRALEAQVQVGEAPVGLALVDEGRRIVVADSNRFSAKGAVANLAVVDVGAALGDRPALLGLIPTGMFPREMAVIPSTNTLLVTDYLSAQVQAVSLKDLP
jgi:DNA-binding beta-propeller fold protein YncE